MSTENLNLIGKTKNLNSRLCNVSGYETNLLEIHAEIPTLQVLFIPGNPGIISFYADFLESLYELLGGTASITAIGHIGHIRENWENGRLFSLEEQIDHKMNFMKQHLQNISIPIVLVGHSIGSYVCIEMFESFPDKVIYCVGLYPFLAVNPDSSKQSIIKKIAVSSILRAVLSSVAASWGLLPRWASSFLAKISIAGSWSPTATEAFCTHLLRYHAVQNMLFLAMTEFKKLSESPNWAFMREKQSQIGFLFGIDDHWGPLKLFEEISKQAPNAALAIEQEAHTHAFSCTEAGSLWVAQYVATLIKGRLSI